MLPSSVNLKALENKLNITFMNAKGEELTVNYNSANGSPVSQSDDWFERNKIEPITD